MPNIVMEWQRFDQLSAEALYQVLRFRQNIFVVEQSSPYPDLDGLDQEAWHLLLRAEGTLAGYLRLLPPADAEAPVRIGRVAVARALRHRGLGHKLVKEALRFCREHYSGLPVALAAQTYLVGFYRRFSFEPSGQPYDDFGVAHVAMARPGG